ncbi:MAG: hypothetical protein HZB92_04975 [Euryarchaeota archaeon]|nr:hypothetical protein [Euryarchaeota archaeon]
MVKNGNKQLLALGITIAMIAVAFASTGGFATQKESPVAEFVKIDPARISPAELVKKGSWIAPPVLKGAGGNSLSLAKPGARTDGIAMLEGFETMTPGNLPDAPWTAGEQPGSAVSWGPYDFEGDTAGQNPTNPPWLTIDGTTPLTYYMRNMEDTTAGQDLRGAYWNGDLGAFGTFNGDVTLLSEAPPAGAPGTLYAGLTSGTLAAHFNEGVDEGLSSYFGPVGIEPTGPVDHAFAGAWIYFSGTANQRLDFLLYDYQIGDGTAMQIVMFNGVTYWYPAGVQTAVTGATFAANSWHELFVEYWEANKTHKIWWDGVPRTTGQAWTDSTMTNIDGLIWFGGDGTAQPAANVYIDNFYHFIPPSGTVEDISVSNAWSSAEVGVNSCYLNQGNSVNVAYTQVSFNPFGWGYPAGIAFDVRTDTLANTNGATFFIKDFSGTNVMGLRFQNPNMQYYTGGGWTTFTAYAATTAYHISLSMSSFAKRYVEVSVNGTNYVTDASLGNTGAGIAGFRAQGTASTQSRIYFDNVQMTGNVHDATIRVNNTIAHTGSNSLKFWEGGAAGVSSVYAYPMGGEGIKYGEMWFWFYAAQPLGGGLVAYASSMGTTATLISLGDDLSGNMLYSPGQVKWVAGDGAGGGTIIDGPTFTPGTWNNISARYFISNHTFQALWNGASQGWYHFIWDTANDMDLIEFDGLAPNCPQEFYYDDIGLWIDNAPAKPTSVYVDMPPAVATTWNNYTVDQDVPIQGTLTGTYSNIDEIDPLDGLTEDIVETNPTVIQNVTLINNEGFESTTFPPTGWTSTGTGWARNTAQFHAGVASAANTGAAGVGDNGNLVSPAVSTAGANFMGVDFWWRHSVSGGTDFFLDYYDNTGVWDQILDIGSIATINTWVHFMSGQITDPQYLHAAFQIRFRAAQEAGDNTWIDEVIVYKVGPVTQPYSLEHRWRTQNIPAGADSLTLYVMATTSAAPDDSFVFGVGPTQYGPFTPTTVIVNSEYFMWYSAPMPLLTGQIYLQVTDSNSADMAQADTLYIDAIRIEWKDVAGSATSVQQATADPPDPANHGTVTGTFALTNPPYNSPPDANAQQITEVFVAGTTTTLFTEAFSVSVPPTSWSQSGPTNQWGQSATANAGGTAPEAMFTYYNAVNEWRLISPVIDTTGMIAMDLTWRTMVDDYAAGCTLWIQTSSDGATWANTAWTWASGGGNLAASIQGVHITTADVGSPTFRVAWAVTQDAYQIDYWYVDDATLTGNYSDKNSLEHRWTMQNLPANALSRNLCVRARTSATPNDNFVIGYSQILAGPYTPVITIDNSSYNNYTAALPLTFDGAFYLNVIDANSFDTTGLDTVYIDTITVNTTTSPVNTSVVVHWTKSTDDGGGANDVAGYNIYASDEYLGEGLTSTHTLIGSSPAGSTYFRHWSEADDRTYMNWYYVTAYDIYSTESNRSGNASKFNRAPAISYLGVSSGAGGNGTWTAWPGIVIPAGTPAVNIWTEVIDDTSTFEDIPKLNTAEWYDTSDPGAGLGTPLAFYAWVDYRTLGLRVDINTAAWAGGTNHHIFVRGHENGPGNTGNGWGAVLDIWINVTAAPVTYTLIPVIAGWNLVSTPWIPADATLPNVLLDTNGDTLWNRAMWCDANSPTRPWKQWYSGWDSSLSDLTAVNVAMGVWIYVTTVGDGFINVTGSAPGTTGIPLYAGWNMVGYPASNDGAYNVGNLKTDTGATIVEGFDGATTYRTQVLADPYVLKKGEGYWVYCPAPATWTISW